VPSEKTMLGVKKKEWTDSRRSLKGCQGPPKGPILKLQREEYLGGKERDIGCGDNKDRPGGQPYEHSNGTMGKKRPHSSYSVHTYGTSYNIFNRLVGKKGRESNSHKLP